MEGNTDSVVHSLAFVFPGQGSQSVGMLAGLTRHRPLIEQTFEEASSRLGIDRWRLAQEGPESDLNRTENTQPALLAAGIAAWRVWESEGGARPAWVAGHSLGEYTALVAAGSLALADGAWLVAERGRAMQQAVPAGSGAMAAILGLDDDTVRAVCAEAAGDEVVTAANLNAPGQVVIAGHRTAVDRAVELCTARGARRAVPLAVSVPSHCALMRPARERLAECIATIDWAPPGIAVIQNATAARSENLGAVRAALVEQLEQPVRWVETVAGLRREGVATVVECGPGRVLSGLVRRIDRELETHSLETDAGLTAALAALGGSPEIQPGENR